MGEESRSAARVDHAPVPVMPDTGPFTFLLRASVSSSEEGGVALNPLQAASSSLHSGSRQYGRLRRLACRVEGCLWEPLPAGKRPRELGAAPAAPLPFTGGFSSPPPPPAAASASEKF